VAREPAVRGRADGSSRAWYIPPVSFFDPVSASIVYRPLVPTIIFEPLHADVSVPSRATAHSAGYDLAAYLTGRTVRVFLDGVMSERPVEERNGAAVLVLHTGERALVPLGFRARLPVGIEAQVRPRSGTSLKTDIVIANAPGTIDADYPDEWCVPVRHGGTRELVITHGERIAQMVLARHEVLEFTPGSVTATTERNGGFGSTGR
jgi:dUTP pyrophosphatase